MINVACAAKGRGGRNAINMMYVIPSRLIVYTMIWKFNSVHTMSIMENTIRTSSNDQSCSLIKCRRTNTLIRAILITLHQQTVKGRKSTRISLLANVFCVGFVLMHPTILKTCILPYALVLPWRNTRIFLKMSVN